MQLAAFVGVVDVVQWLGGAVMAQQEHALFRGAWRIVYKEECSELGCSMFARSLLTIICQLLRLEV